MESLPEAVGTKRNKPFCRKVPVLGHLRTYKIRMLPTTEQLAELKRTFSAARKAYNWALDRVRNHNDRPNNIALRTAFREANPLPNWAKDSKGKPVVASMILAGAIKQVTDTYSSNFAKRRKDPSHTFEVKFRSTRRTTSEVVKIEKDRPEKKMSTLLRFEDIAHPYAKSLAKARRHGRKECTVLFGSNLQPTGGIVLQDSPSVIGRLLAEGSRLKEDAKIQYDKATNHFHLIYTFEAPRLPDPDPNFNNKRVVAHDPGVRAFQTWYSPTSGEYGVLLDGFQSQIEPRLHKLDALQSRIDRRYTTAANNKRVLRPQPPNRSRRQWRRTTRTLKRKRARDSARQRGWTEYAHYFAANQVLREHDLIIQPWLKCAELVPRDGRVLVSKSVRAMLTMSHYKYRQRLEWASTRYAGRHVLVSEEPGTSKTCTNCGFWHASLGASEVFECPRCDIKVGRDIAGARNNFFSEYGRAVGIGWDRVSG